MTFALYVTDLNAVLLVCALICLPILCFQATGWASEEWSVVLLAATGGAIGMQLYNGIVVGLAGWLQFADSQWQLYIWMVITVALSTAMHYFSSIGGGIVVALILLMGVGGSYGRGVDWVNNTLNINITTGELTGFWIVMLMVVVQVQWAISRIRWIHALMLVLINSCLLVLILHVVSMYVNQAQAGYDLLVFDLSLLVEFSAALLFMSLAFYCTRRRIHILAEERKKHIYTRLAMQEWMEEEKDGRDKLRKLLATQTQTETPQQPVTVTVTSIPPHPLPPPPSISSSPTPFPPPSLPPTPPHAPPVVLPTANEHPHPHPHHNKRPAHHYPLSHHHHHPPRTVHPTPV